MKPKYVIVIPDGAADEPLEVFEGKTILEAADTPAIDKISESGRQGLAFTVPKGFTPGSDVAMMSLLGYDPDEYYTGRAPIEAVAMGIDMDKDDWIFRCNLVTIADKCMADHSAGHITDKEAKDLIAQATENLGSDDIKFFNGVSYRNLCLFKNHEFKNIKTIPPHDIIGQPVDKNLPKGKHSDVLVNLMARSSQLFEQSEINKVRKDLGENPVSSIWLWGQGQQAFLEKFSTRFGLKGAAITAVDLVRGLSKLIGFDLISVPGATGYVDTNYTGKANAAIKALKDNDIVLVHVEAPDEAGHAGSVDTKKLAVENIDKFIVGPIYNELQKYDSWRMLVMPDHPTPCSSQAHSADPVPFAMAGTNVESNLKKPFGESNSAESGFVIEKGCQLMEYFLKI